MPMDQLNIPPSPQSNSQDLLLKMIEAAKAQTRAELERASIDKETLEEKRKIRVAEEERSKLLTKISSQLDLLTKLVADSLYPEVRDLTGTTQLAVELLRILASSIAGNISDKRLNDSLQELLVKITNNKSNVIVHTESKTLNSGKDINIKADNDVNLGE